jgi:NAD(P)-dependent dehydrogenase (short-subunit alcohol dehydrogenase family)
VTDASSCERVVSATVGRFGPPSVLVNNVAARGQQVPIHLFEESAWDEALAVNLKSAMLMCKYVLPHMIENGGGAIVNISSAAGMVSYGVPAYGAAKAGMLSLTRDLAAFYAEHGIRANSISPGNIHTPMVAAMKPDVRERRRRATPLGEGDAWDIGWAAVFLASDEASFITGQNLPVDGGISHVSRYTAAMWA